MRPGEWVINVEVGNMKADIDVTTRAYCTYINCT